MGRGIRTGRTDSTSDEVGIFAMCGVPVASVEDTDHIIAYGRERFEEANEAMLVVDLSYNVARLAYCGEDRSDKRQAMGIGS
jgi:hypothetical protein